MTGAAAHALRRVNWEFVMSLLRPAGQVSGRDAPHRRGIFQRLRASSRMRAAALVAPLLLLGACAATVEIKAPPLALFDDAAFAPATQPIDPKDVFKLSPEMQHYIDDHIMPFSRRADLRQALLDELYTRDKLRLDYDATMTRNASEAFAARSGNCLSLVLMTGAFAQAMGLEVTYQQITTDEIWSRAGDMYFMSGHVNLQLDRQLADRAAEKWDRYGRYTVDFMPSEDGAALHAHEISERTILAMYMNNRAAEAMIANQLDDAYWRVRDALKLDPAFFAAYNTLGVVYLRRGDPLHAELALRFALDQEKDNPRVMSNYVQALRGLGREDEAKAYEARLAAVEPFPPFYFFNRGKAALQAGNLAAARELFQKELKRDPDYHEFHYWLAITDFDLGDVDNARRELALALEDAVKRTDHDLYAAKLDRLKAYRPQPVVQ